METSSPCLSRDVFHSDKSSPFYHFPFVEIPYRAELRLACVEPSVRRWTIPRLCPPFATVRLWVGALSHRRLCLICGGTRYMVHGTWCMVHGTWNMVHGVWGMVRDTWYLVIERVRKCPVAITGHLHLLIDLARPC